MHLMKRLIKSQYYKVVLDKIRFSATLKHTEETCLEDLKLQNMWQRIMWINPNSRISTDRPISYCVSLDTEQSEAIALEQGIKKADRKNFHTD